jgi:tRNA(Met) cytidine acetyltransferase
VADISAVVSLARRLGEQAAAAGHRRMLVLSGDRQWAGFSAGAVRDALGTDRALWLGAPSAAQPDAVPASRATRYLGRELDLLVFDAYAGLDPDAFAAISGTLAAGGLLILVAPPLADWPAWPDPECRRLAVHPFRPEDVTGRFLAWFAGRLAADDTVTLVEEGKALRGLPAHVAVPATVRATSDPDCLTADQAAAVAAVLRTAVGHRHRPLVLTADRGRGKSASLGIAAARLVGQGCGKRVLVTAPRPAAVAAVFEHAARLLPGAVRRRSQLAWAGGSLAYAAPDALLLEPRAADLLMVDEAAAIPAGLLEGLVARYPRTVFATTVHGYEGSGRGFALRFGHTLDRLAPGWRSLRMDTPVRWAPGDPLEAFVFRSLLLDAEPASLPDGGGPRPPWHIERIDRDVLTGDERLLRQVFGLLVAAHYRTTPLDLRHLLDGPNLQVWVGRWDGRVVATALVAVEGRFDGGLAHAVWAGRRRPRGHLLPQALALHAGAGEACKLGAVRIIRLAVHPSVRRRGVGTALLQRLLVAAGADGLDLVGASFAATPGLVRFWSRAGFVTARVGARRETGSGARAVLMLRGASDAGTALAARVRRNFLRDFPLELGDFLGDLEPSLVEAVMTEESATAPALWPDDLQRLKGFAEERRLFEPTRAALVRLVGAVLPLAGAWQTLSDTGRTALVVRVLQARSWEASARAAGVAGRDALVAELRRATSALLAYLEHPERGSVAGGVTPGEA